MITTRLTKLARLLLEQSDRVAGKVLLLGARH